MGIYIYKQDTSRGFVFISSPTKPASAAKFDQVNGSNPSSKAFILLESVSDIIAAKIGNGKDFKTWRDALKTYVDDVGGYSGLTIAEREIVARYNIGTGAEIATAIPNVLERDAWSLQYLDEMKCKVRPRRARKLEAVTWSRCKQFNIDVGGGVLVPMPEVIYSTITISNPTTGEISGNLLANYEYAGIGGFASGDKLLGILDYLLSTAGTRFAGAGFLEQFAGITPDGFNSLADFRDYLVGIIAYGDLDTVVEAV